MLMQIVSVLLTCSFFASCKTVSSSLLNKTPSLPHYNVQKVDESIKIDGDLSESTWAKAEEIQSIFPWSTGEIKESVTAKILWDDENIYVGYDNIDHYVQSVVKDFDGNVFRDDCVEFFVAPNDTDVTQYFGYEMNVLGTLLDYTASQAGQGPTKSFDYKWNSKDVKIKTALKKTDFERRC